MTDAEVEACELERQLCNGSGPRRLCDCPECEVAGVRYPLHRREDCEYATLRSTLVGQAEEKARKHRGRNGDGFNKLFTDAMTSLSEQLGL
jgi:hypothetical protein